MTVLWLVAACAADPGAPASAAPSEPAEHPEEALVRHLDGERSLMTPGPERRPNLNFGLSEPPADAWRDVSVQHALLGAAVASYRFKSIDVHCATLPEPEADTSREGAAARLDVEPDDGCYAFVHVPTAAGTELGWVIERGLRGTLWLSGLGAVVASELESTHTRLQLTERVVPHSDTDSRVRRTRLSDYRDDQQGPICDAEPPFVAVPNAVAAACGKPLERGVVLSAIVLPDGSVVQPGLTLPEGTVGSRFRDCAVATIASLRLPATGCPPAPVLQPL